MLIGVGDRHVVHTVILVAVAVVGAVRRFGVAGSNSIILFHVGDTVVRGDISRDSALGDLAGAGPERIARAVHCLIGHIARGFGVIERDDIVRAGGSELTILQAAACGVMSIHSRSGRSVLLADLHLLLVRRQALNRRCGALVAGVDGNIGHVVLIEECDRLDLILFAAVLTMNVCDGNRRGGLSVRILIQRLVSIIHLYADQLIFRPVDSGDVVVVDRIGVAAGVGVQRVCAGCRILDDAGDCNNIQRAVSCRVANGIFTGILYIIFAVAILILEETSVQCQLDRLKILFVCGIGKFFAVDLCDIPCVIRCLCVQDKRVIRCHIA